MIGDYWSIIIFSGAKFCGSYEAPLSDGEAISMVDYLNTSTSDFCEVPSGTFYFMTSSEMVSDGF